MYYAQLALLILASVFYPRAGVAADRSSVKITYVTLSFIEYKGGHRDLESISFSIQNTAKTPLEWARIRAVFRSYAGELIHTETFERDFVRKPIGPEEALRITHYVKVKGFFIEGKRGSVDVRIVDFRLSPEGISNSKEGESTVVGKEQKMNHPWRENAERNKILELWEKIRKEREQNEGLQR